MTQPEESIIDFHQYNPWLTQFATESSDPVVRDSAEMIKYCLSLEKQMPSEYSWRYTELEAFRETAKKLKAPEDLNVLYWGDMAHNFEAYSITTFWRGIELIKPLIRSLNVKEIITPAVLSRSLLELAASFIENANIIQKTIEQMPAHQKDEIEISEFLEQLSVRILFGSRLGSNIPEHLKQKNVLSTLQRLTKNPNAVDLFPTYEFLCEIAHPNVIGNARFWGEALRKNNDGSETIRISRQHDTIANREILQKILWAVGWSAVCLRNGFHLIKEAIATIMVRFPRLKTSIINKER